MNKPNEINGPRLAMQALLDLHGFLFAAIDRKEITELNEIYRIAEFARKRLAVFALDWVHVGTENVYEETRGYHFGPFSITVIDSLGEGYLLVGHRPVYPELSGPPFVALAWINNKPWEDGWLKEIEAVFIGDGVYRYRGTETLGESAWIKAVEAFAEDERRRIEEPWA